MLTLMEREHRAPKFAGQLRRPKARKSMPRNEKRYIVSSYENLGPPHKEHLLYILVACSAAGECAPNAPSWPSAPLRDCLWRPPGWDQFAAPAQSVTQLRSISPARPEPLPDSLPR